jgi:ABC-type multidrug transport system ATPase subunit
VALPAVRLSSAELIRVSRLTKTYGQVLALDDVGFSLRSGEILGLIGPNGAGKTTIFECLAGLLPFDAGTIDAADGVTWFYVPDGISPWPQETVRWALDFGVGFFGGRSEDRDAAIAALNLTPLLDVRIGALSKGQRKRAMLGIGLASPAPILLVDEPFEGLDLRQTREIVRALRAEVARGRTLLLSIHQIADAARVCDRFVLLSNGRVRGEGTLDELRAIDAGAFAGAPLEEVFLALT